MRGIHLDEAELGLQGIKHDRTFMLFRVTDQGELKKIQLADYPECSLFAQELVGNAIHVRYLTPTEPLVPSRPEQNMVLEVPLEPDLEKLKRTDVNLHQSMVSAYRVGPKYDEWFSACFGFETILVYIGDARRPILGTFSPKSSQPAKGWLFSITSSLTTQSEPDWLAFSDCSPFLITTETSLRNVSARLESGDMEMAKFRPNVVVDGEGEWDEDFWAELSLNGTPTFTLSKMCNRCSSINVDYSTGRLAEGEYGIVLKKLMSDRRVDSGKKFAPVFGRYGFLRDGVSKTGVSLGDDVSVTRRNTERPVWDWPLKDKSSAKFYHQRV